MSNNNHWSGYGYISTFDKSQTLEPKVYNSSQKEFKTLDFNLSAKRTFKNKDGKYSYDNIMVRATNAKADFISKYFKNGDPISISGPIRTGKYEKDGRTIYTMYISVENAEFLPNINSRSTSENAPVQQNANENGSAIHDSYLNADIDYDNNISMYDSDEDLPF